MPLIRIDTLPPGGFPYKNPGTGKDFPGMTAFGHQVEAIVKYRRGNNLPGADAQTAASDLDSYTCQRLGNDPRFCSDPNSQKKTSSLSTADVPDVPHAGVVANLLAGAATIREAWLGEGRDPVDPVLAQRRSDICTQECVADPLINREHSHNQQGKFFERVKAVVGQAILEQRRIKTGLGLVVNGEEKLNTCDICGCHLPLKVWTPMDVIMKRLKEPLENFPPHCWMRKENTQPTTNPTTT
jgi:hypothetical protein